MADLSELREKIEQVRQSIMDSTEGITDRAQAYEIRKNFLEKSGRIGQLMRFMREVDPSQKAEYGKSVNELKTWAMNYFEGLDDKMKAKALQQRYEA